VSNLAGYEEERLDQFVFRPLAHPFAVVFAKLGFTPNAVSIVGMLCGIAGGYFFMFREASVVVWGVLLFSMLNILDYADGQLARLTGKGTKYGYYFDGLCDYGAYVAVYMFAVVGVWPEYGVWGLALAAAAANSGGYHAALLDFFKGEYRYWALGSDKDRFRGPDELEPERAEVRGFDRFLLRLAIQYTARQSMLSKDRRARAAGWEPHRADERFRERYSRMNRWTLRLLFLTGPNWQAYLFFAFGLLGRMDLFFWTQLVVQNGLFGAAWLAQKRIDAKLTAEFP
jgi:hypothetical protein